MSGLAADETAAASPAGASLSWPSPLLGFQRQGVLALLSQEALLLADDMGLGKTVQALAALRLLAHRGEVKRCLVVAPAGLLTQWRRELSLWAPELAVLRVDGPPQERAWKWSADKHVYLVSYETARADTRRILERTWDLVILDEAQRIKNRGAAVSRACKGFPRRRSWALTGTPLENHEDELASVLEFVRPNPEGRSLPLLRPGYRLRALHQDLQLRRRKQEVLSELPPCRVVRVALDLTAEQRETYRNLELEGRRHLAGLGSSATVMNVLELISRLKQVCNFCPRTGHSAKLDDLRDRLNTLRSEGHRALLFSQWTNGSFGVARLAQELRGFGPLTYTGDLSLSERAACIDLFRRDPRHGVLILSLKAGGQGLNLQEASYVVHFDRWWNPAVENQATDRAHRMGQRQAVTVYAYLCVDTIEERIEEILDRKRALFQALVDGVSLDVRRLLTHEELFGLFDLPAPARHPGGRGPARRESLGPRVEGLARGLGWRPVALGRQGFEGRRLSEIGLEQSLHVRWVQEGGKDAAEAVEELGAAGEGPEPTRILICPTGVEAGVAARAGELGVAVWDAHSLEQAEKLLLEGER